MSENSPAEEKSQNNGNGNGPTGTGAGIKGLKGLIAGGIAGAVEIVITYPTEYAKIQLQLDLNTGKDRKHKGFIDCLRKTKKAYGFRGLYRGLPVDLWGAVPKAGVRFGAFQEMQGWLQERNLRDTEQKKLKPCRNLTPMQNMLCGLWAGVVSGFLLVTPLSRIKIRFMHDFKSKNPQFNKGLYHGFTEIIKQEGIKGCYKGLWPTVLYNGGIQAIRFTLVESFKDIYVEREIDRRGKNRKEFEFHPSEIKEMATATTTKTACVSESDIYLAVAPKWLIGLIGSVAGGVSVIACAPLDVIKTRMQGMNSAIYKNSTDCFLKLWKREGVSGLYKGSVPKITHACAEAAIVFVVFESVMEVLNVFF